MQFLGIGLTEASHHEDALSVKEAELATLRRLGDSEENILSTQSNLAKTYSALGRLEEALRLRRDVYFGYLKLKGEEDAKTILEANNYAFSLFCLERFEETKTFLRKAMVVARRALGTSHITTLRLRWIYAKALYMDDGATLDDLREAVMTLEEAERTARRILGGAHPVTDATERALRHSRAVLGARDTAPSGSA